MPCLATSPSGRPTQSLHATSAACRRRATPPSNVRGAAIHPRYRAAPRCLTPPPALARPGRAGRHSLPARRSWFAARRCAPMYFSADTRRQAAASRPAVSAVMRPRRPERSFAPRSRPPPHEIRHANRSRRTLLVAANCALLDLLCPTGLSYTNSSARAVPPPVPWQIDARPHSPSCCRSAWISVTIMRAPEQPIG